MQSQRHEGWVVLPQLYHDGGFTGGNTDRPALQRLLADIEAGEIDVVIVYKIDRLSRSLVDFLQLMQRFDDHNVALASVTQQIRTDSSMGRLMLNILAAFGEYERELIAERTKDKMGAARRKGKFVGGGLPLGYDLDAGPTGSKLRVNPTEATTVRELFRLYRMHQGLLPVVKEAAKRGWRTKTWVTRDGKVKEGGMLDRPNLHRLLTNVVYIGKVEYEGETFEGEHEAIIDEVLFNEVQAMLKGQARTKGIHGGNGHPDALLKSLLRCGHCGYAMIHGHTRKSTGTRYRYYTCTTSQKHGVGICPTSTVPAAALEGFVVEQIRTLTTQPAMMQQVIAEAESVRATRVTELQQDVTTLETHLLERERAGQHLARVLEAEEAASPNTLILEQLQQIEREIADTSQALAEVRQELAALTARKVSLHTFRAALELFDPVWEVLYPVERARILRLLIEQVDYNAGTGKVGITFRPTGIAALYDEMVAAQHCAQ
ncbi:MAG: DNA-invertase hin [bacterium ADurb.Bin429]|nr:MAG: DNA-invertase hin [bacterium ADurb.Bin429]